MSRILLDGDKIVCKDQYDTEEMAWMTGDSIGLCSFYESGYSYFTKEELDDYIESLKVLRQRMK